LIWQVLIYTLKSNNNSLLNGIECHYLEVVMGDLINVLFLDALELKVNIFTLLTFY